MQISANGGRRPIWDPDGKRIYFMEGNARMIVATITRDPALRFVSRSTLFEGRHEGDYDLAKDGRFLMLDIESANTSLVVIPNWRTELKRLTSSPAARRP